MFLALIPVGVTCPVITLKNAKWVPHDNGVQYKTKNTIHCISGHIFEEGKSLRSNIVCNEKGNWDGPYVQDCQGKNSAIGVGLPNCPLATWRYFFVVYFDAINLVVFFRARTIYWLFTIRLIGLKQFAYCWRFTGNFTEPVSKRTQCCWYVQTPLYWPEAFVHK